MTALFWKWGTKMDYENMRSLLVDETHFDEKVQDNYMNDSGSFAIACDGWFNYCGFSVKYVVVNGDGQIFFSQNTSSNTYYYLNVNQRDMSSWNIWRQEGTIRRVNQFLRIRWDGYSSYSSKQDAYHLVFDVVIVSNERIYVSIVDWPTSYANGSCFLKYGGNTSLQTSYAPSKDGDVFTFIGANNQGSAWTLSNGISEPEYPDIRYLLRSEGKLYTVSNGKPKPLTETETSATLFQEQGMLSLPSYSTYSSLNNVDVLCWAKEDYGLSLSMTLKGRRSQMDVDTNDLAVTYPVNRVWITGDENTKYQVSFDSGKTWVYYEDSSWKDGTENVLLGNTVAQIHDIPMAAWQEKITASRIRFRCRMTNTEEFLSSIEVGSQKNYEDAYGTDCPY